MEGIIFIIVDKTWYPAKIVQRLISEALLVLFHGATILVAWKPSSCGYVPVDLIARKEVA